MNKIYILFLLFYFKVYSSRITIYSEDKKDVYIDISGFEKKRGKIFLIENLSDEEVSIICKIDGKEIRKIVQISYDDDCIYAISKESNGKYSIRYRGKGKENYNFLKLYELERISLNRNPDNTHIALVEEVKKNNKQEITKNVSNTLNKMLPEKNKISKVINRDYYNKIINKLEDLDLDSDKMMVIKKAFNKNKKIDSNQAIKILSIIDNEVVRLEAAKSIYKYCGEKEKFKDEIFDIFVYDYTRIQLRNYLN